MLSIMYFDLYMDDTPVYMVCIFVASIVFSEMLNIICSHASKVISRAVNRPIRADGKPPTIGLCRMDGG